MICLTMHWQLMLRTKGKMHMVMQWEPGTKPTVTGCAKQGCYDPI